MTDLDALEQVARAATEHYHCPNCGTSVVIESQPAYLAAVREADALREEVAMLRAKIGAYETAVREFRAILSPTEPAE